MCSSSAMLFPLQLKLIIPALETSKQQFFQPWRVCEQSVIIVALTISLGLDKGGKPIEPRTFFSFPYGFYYTF